MPIGSRFTHTVSIVRQLDSGTFDAHGQPITSDDVRATVKAAIQPRTANEEPAVSQGGSAVSDHVIFMFPTEVTTADAIEHDAAVCLVTNDLPTSRFEIIGTPNAAGLGHHLEIEARLIEAASEAEGS